VAEGPADLAMTFRAPAAVRRPTLASAEPPRPRASSPRLAPDRPGRLEAGPLAAVDPAGEPAPEPAPTQLATQAVAPPRSVETSGAEDRELAAAGAPPSPPARQAALLVRYQSEGDVLGLAGASGGSASALTGIRSGTPLRMASAITARAP
jgi:hypothetical protein